MYVGIYVDALGSAARPTLLVLTETDRDNLPGLVIDGVCRFTLLGKGRSHLVMIKNVQVELWLIKWFESILVLQERLVDLSVRLEVEELDRVTKVLILVLYHNLGWQHLEAA